MSKIQNHDKVWKSHEEHNQYFIRFNKEKDEYMLLDEEWIERVIGKAFLTNLKQKENIDRMFPLTNADYANIQIDLVKQREKNMNTIHKYLDSKKRFQLCPSTKVYDTEGQFVNHRHHKDEPLTPEWMAELRELNPDNSEFLTYLILFQWRSLDVCGL